MNQMINFPNLGIHWENVGQKITVLGFDITYYGMIVGAAILTGILLTVLIADRTGQDVEDYLTLSIYLIIFGAIGARIYYLLFGFSEYKGHFLKIFNPRAGGFAIYGAIIAGIITIIIFSKIRGLAAWKVLDTFVPALLIGQIFGRIGNFCNREAFGEYTNGLFAMQLPVDSVRVADVTEKMRRHLEKIDGVNMIQVSPAALYEAVWCLFILILIVVYRRFQSYKGELFLIYMISYGVGRFFIEGIRVDKLRIPLINLPVSQVVAVVSAILAAILLYFNYANGESSGRGFSHSRKRKHKRELRLPK